MQPTGGYPAIDIAGRRPRRRGKSSIRLGLAAPALGFQWVHVSTGDPQSLAKSWAFGCALYVAAIVYLLRYVFQREVMTTDKLFGAAAAYLTALLGHPFVREWEKAALAETTIIEADEPRIIYRDKLAGAPSP